MNNVLKFAFISEIKKYLSWAKHFSRKVLIKIYRYTIPDGPT